MNQITPEYASQTKGPRILGVFWSFFLVSVLMVSARLYIRMRWLKNIGLDDYIIAVAMVANLPLTQTEHIISAKSAS